MVIIETDFISELEKALDEGKDTSREYERAIAKLAGEGPFDESAALNLVNNADKKIDRELKIAYAAFYCLNSYYRYNFNNSKLEDIWKKSHNKFNEFESIKHLDVLLFLLNLNSKENFEEQKYYLELARENAENYSDNSGYLHAFADLYASIVEKNEGHEDYANRYEKLKAFENDALEAVNKAMHIEESAKFYCTLGRIQSIMSNYMDADINICKAIAAEIPARFDYALRIEYYQYHRLMNRTKQRISGFQSQINGLQEQVDNKNEATISQIDDTKKIIKSLKKSVVSNIEMIGLFSGIIALVLGSLTIANGQTAIQAGLLIFTLMGCLAAALAAFSLLLHLTDDKYSKPIALSIIAVSLVISIAATFLSWYFEKNTYLEQTENSPDNGISYSSENMEEKNV